MRKTVIIAAGAIGTLVVLGFVGAFAYYFTGIRTAPKPLTLSTPSPAASASATVSPAAGGLAGTWSVGSGSLAGYRVSEKFGGQTSSHEAVAQTSSVTGSLTVAGSQASSINLAVDLSSLHSVDQVLGFNVSNRDRIVSQSLSVQQFPQATFKADSITLPAGLESGQQVTLSVPGQLTIHGVTRAVTASIQAQLSGSTVQVAGSIATNMTDFGISPPQVPITVVQPGVTIEFKLNLNR